MEANEDIYQYIKENRKEGVTAQDIAEIFGIKRNVASHYLNCLEKDGKLQKGQTRPVHFSISTNEDDLEKSGYMESDVKETEHNNSVFSGLIGCNGSMEQVIEKCKAAVNYPVNGLTMIICGASGVGKSYLASLIHQYAMEVGAIEKDAPFVVLNCADYANNSELLSSVLFGHVKGAFTGADSTKKGYFNEAEGGTLFLDEVGNLALETQQMLLRAIQERRYRPIGDKSDKSFNVRIIAATNEDLDNCGRA